MREPGGAGGLTGHSGNDRASSQGGAMGQMADVESGSQRLEAENRDPPTTMSLETGSPGREIINSLLDCGRVDMEFIRGRHFLESSLSGCCKLGRFYNGSRHLGRS